MPSIGWFEILIIVVIAIIFLGPKDFPVVLKKLSHGIFKLKRYISNIQNEVTNIVIDDNEIKKNKDHKDE